MTPNRDVLLHQSDARLEYKGDGDYDLVIGPARIEFSYDGSDYAVGTWMFWNVNLDGERFGGTHTVGPGRLHDWLEDHARGEGGRLADEPERAA